MAKGRGKPKQARPADWTQDRVLELLRGGVPMRMICQAFADRSDCEATATALLQETNRWRKKSQDFDKKVIAAMKGNGGHAGPIATKGSSALSVETGEEKWWCDFTEHMTAPGATVRSGCEAAGVNYRTFIARVSDFEGNPNYDPTLNARWTAFRLSLSGHFTAVQMDAVGEIDNPYLRGLLAGKVAARLDGSDRRHSLVVSGTVDHEHRHTHELIGDARRHITDRMRAICTTEDGVEVLPP